MHAHPAPVRLAALALALTMIAWTAPNANAARACGPASPEGSNHGPTGTLVWPDRIPWLYFYDADGGGNLTSWKFEIRGPDLAPGIAPDLGWQDVSHNGAGGGQFTDNWFYFAYRPPTAIFAPGHYEARVTMTEDCPDATGQPATSTFQWGWSVDTPHDNPINDNFWGFATEGGTHDTAQFDVDAAHAYLRLDRDTLDYSHTYATENATVSGDWFGSISLNVWLQPARPAILP
jgi:hypothetical protein